MHTSSIARITSALAIAAAVATMGGCGGGGDGASDIVGTGGTGAISGTVTKGPVSGATVVAFAVAGGAPGARLGSATTDASGNFTMAIGSYSGPMMLQAGGGSYRDEATGQTMAMEPADMMTAVLPSVAAGTTTSGIQVTPVTAMAQAMASRMSGGMTAANMGVANAAMGSYFGVSDIVHVQPMNPLQAGSGAAASQDARNYGMTLAGMSQYARSAGLGSSSTLVTAMMNDASDGVIDGRQSGVQVSMPMGGMMGSATTMMPATAGTTGLATAMGAFIGSAANQSGLTPADMNSLMQKLGTASGRL